MIYSTVFRSILILCFISSYAMDSCILTSQEDVELIPRSVESLYQLCLPSAVKLLVAESHEDHPCVKQIHAGTLHTQEIKEALIRDHLVPLARECKDEYTITSIDHGDNRRPQYMYPVYRIYELAFSPGGTHLACASSKMYIWNLENLPQLKDPLILEEEEDMMDVDAVQRKCEVALRWSEDGTQLYANKKTCRDDFLFCWDTKTGKLLSHQTLTYAEGKRCLRDSYKPAFSPNGKYILGSRDGKEGSLTEFKSLKTIDKFSKEAVLTDVHDLTSRVVGTYECNLEKGTGTVLRIGFSPDNKYIVTIGCGFSLRLIEIDTLPTSNPIHLNHAGIVCAFAFSPNNKYLVTACLTQVNSSEDRFVCKAVLYLWDLTKYTYKIVSEFGLRYYDDIPVVIAFDGRYVLTPIGDDGIPYYIYLVDCITNESVAIGKVSSDITALVFHPNGDYAFFGCDENNLHLLPLNKPIQNKSLADLLLLIKQQQSLNKKINSFY